MVVVPTDVVGALTHPVNARLRLGAMVDEVAEADHAIRTLGHPAERLVVCVDVGDDEDLAEREADPLDQTPKDGPMGPDIDG